MPHQTFLLKWLFLGQLPKVEFVLKHLGAENSIVPGKVTIGDLTILALFMASQYFKIEDVFYTHVPSAQKGLQIVCRNLTQSVSSLILIIPGLKWFLTQKYVKTWKLIKAHSCQFIEESNSCKSSWTRKICPFLSILNSDFESQ